MIKKVRLTTTIALLRKHSACESGYRKLLKSLGAKWPADKPINLLRVLKSNGVDDMTWCFRATEQNCDKVARLIAADFAESVLKHFTKEHPNDNRPALAIKAARAFANGRIDAAARDAARDAAWAAAGAAAWAAAGAAVKEKCAAFVLERLEAKKPLKK